MGCPLASISTILTVYIGGLKLTEGTVSAGNIAEFVIYVNLLGTFDIQIDNDLKPRQDITVTATAPDGSSRDLTLWCRIDTPVEIDYYRNGGILQFVLRQLVRESNVVTA